MQIESELFFTYRYTCAKNSRALAAARSVCDSSLLVQLGKNFMTLKAVHEETTAPELFRFSKAQRKSSVHGQYWS